MKKVSQILSHKGRRIISVTPEMTVLEALQIMANQNIGSVLVMEGNQYLGIMTERDYSRKVILLGKSSTDTPVAELASLALPYIRVRLADDDILYRMANHFQLGRLREPTRVRFQSAINLARQALTSGAIRT